MYIFSPTSNHRDHEISSVMQFTYCIVMHTLPMLDIAGIKYKALSYVIFIPYAIGKKIL